jgi:DNA polymerase-3 subunit alpha
MAANLSVEKDTPDKLTVMLSECRRLGIPVVAPDLATSGPDFTPSADRILYGLGCVKYVGDKLMRAVIADRKKNGPYADLTDAISRFIGCGGNRRALESLAKAGALDAFGDRGSLVEGVTELAETVRKAQNKPAINLFGERTMPDLSVPAVSVDRQTLLRWEKTVLGTYVSDHPLHGVVYSEESGIVPIGGVEEGQRVQVGAQVTEVRVTETKKGAAMGLLKLEDLSGVIDAVVFPKVWVGVQVEADALVLVEGSVEDRYGKLQIVVNRIAPLEQQMSLGAVGLEVRLPVGDMERVKRAYLLLCGSTGNQPVRVTCEDVRVPLPLQGVTPTPGLIAGLSDLLGPDAVVTL